MGLSAVGRGGAAVGSRNPGARPCQQSLSLAHYINCSVISAARGSLDTQHISLFQSLFAERLPGVLGAHPSMTGATARPEIEMDVFQRQRKPTGNGHKGQASRAGRGAGRVQGARPTPTTLLTGLPTL